MVLRRYTAMVCYRRSGFSIIFLCLYPRFFDGIADACLGNLRLTTPLIF
jgi:hypothetical protein